MSEKFLYKKLTELLGIIARDLNAYGAAIFDLSGLPIAKWLGSRKDIEQALKTVTWTIIMIDKLITESLGKHRKTLILDTDNDRILIKQIEDKQLKCYLSVITPLDTPLGIILFESEFIEGELSRLSVKLQQVGSSGSSKKVKSNINIVDQETVNESITELLSKIESHPLFKLLSSSVKKK